MSQSISGLASGLDTAAIIDQLVSIERQSEDLVKARGTTAQTALASYAAIRTQLAGVRTAASALAHVADWRPLSATSSNNDAVSVSAGAGTFGGTVSFTVDALAKAGSLRSSNTLVGTTAVVAADTGIMVAAGGAKIGFASFASDDTLTIGSHDITVTQSSAAAIKNGGTALAASTVIDGTNDTLNIEVNGVAKVLTLAHGTYDRTQLAAAVQTAATSAGADVTATVDSSTNKIKIATNREGSAATIQVMGGSALTPLQLATDGAALLGTDGKVKVDDGIEQTLSNIEAGASTVIPAAAGNVTAVFSGGLRAGSVTANNVTAGDGSLATVVANINAAGAGVTATAVQVGDNLYRLQLASNNAGALNGVSMAASEFDAGIGGFVDLTTASDAKLTVGTGAGAYEVTSASNTVSGLLPGVTVTLKQTTAADAPVTITASRDVGAIAAKVQALVDAANKVKSSIDTATAYDKDTNQASPLTGDSGARRIMFELSRALTDAVPGASPGSPGLAGLSVDKTGQFTFDSSKFTAAFNSDPEGMMRVFAQGGTATDSSVTFVSAGERARAGTYAVAITTAAEQASNVGLEGSWPIGSPPTVAREGRHQRGRVRSEGDRHPIRRRQRAQRGVRGGRPPTAGQRVGHRHQGQHDRVRHQRQVLRRVGRQHVELVRRGGRRGHDRRCRGDGIGPAAQHRVRRSGAGRPGAEHHRDRAGRAGRLHVPAGRRGTRRHDAERRHRRRHGIRHLIGELTKSAQDIHR